MLESKFQSKLIQELRDLFPGCVVLKNDPTYLQGVPDLIVLWDIHWAMLEVKREDGAPRRPNQAYYVRLLDNMSFAAIISPENKEGVLRDLQNAFASARSARTN